MRLRTAAAAAMAALVLPAAAAAEDMEFTVDEVEGVAERGGANAPPSEALANALRLYQQAAYREAAVQLEEVASGRTGDGPAGVERAQYYLGCALFHLGFSQASLATFEEIVERGRAHSHFDATLPWLVQLSRRLPEPAGVIDAMAQFGDSLEVARRFDRPETADVYGDLLFLMGRSWYDRGEMEAARRFLLEVPRESPHHYEARFFAAVTHVRERHAAPAARIVRGLLDELSARLFPTARERRYRDLAWLTLARIYYSSRHWASALEAWSRVPPSSEYWTEALFEGSWARFQADGFGRALGNVHALGSPYLSPRARPEAMVLRSVIFFERCQYELADQAVTAFQARYQPVRDALLAAAPPDEDAEAWTAFVERVGDGRAELPEAAEEAARDAMRDRALLRHFAYLRALDAEEQRLSEMPPAFARSELGARILQEVAVARAAAREEAARTARSRYERFVDELQELLNQATAISIEVLAAERRAVQGGDPRRDRETPAVRADAEHVLWPFEGEYWRDELGTYEQPVADLCSR